MATRTLPLVFACIFTLTGCATSTFVADQATKYNLALEKSNNEVLLLNVIRASQRRPLYFTALTKFSGMGGSIGSGATIELGPGSSSIYKITPSANLSPAFDVAPLDTQEFMRGFLLPVGMDTVEYYWRQGWPKSLLLTLLIARIEADGESIIQNYPPDKEQYDNFKGYLRYLLDQGNNKDGALLLKKVEVKKDAIGPSFDSTTMKVADVKALMEVTNAPNYSIEFDKNTLKSQLYKTERRFIFCKSKNCDKIEPISNPADSSISLPEIEHLSNEPHPTVAEDSASALAYKAASSPSEAILRSPEGIIYFLGEIVRTELNNNDDIPTVDICKTKSANNTQPAKPAKLFYVREATLEDINPHLSVTYDGKRYVVPRLSNDSDSCEGQRTMHVLSLIAQLVEMQKSGKDLPTTASVRLVGQ